MLRALLILAELRQWLGVLTGEGRECFLGTSENLVVLPADQGRAVAAAGWRAAMTSPKTIVNDMV